MAKATPAEAPFPARVAPAGSIHEWHDYDGQHNATVPADGIFLPENQSEVEHADRQGWPVVSARRPAAPAKKRAKPATKPTPAKPAAKAAEETV